MINIESFFREKIPGAQFSYTPKGSDKERYESIIFHDGNKKPEFSEFEEWKQIKEKELEKTKYSRQREKEYPQLQDVIVALWELVVELRPEESARIQKERLAVKKKYPKGRV